MMVVLLFTIFFLNSMQDLIFLVLMEFHSNKFVSFFLVSLFNFNNWFLYYGNDSLLLKTIFSSAFYSALLIGIIYYIEKKSYQEMRVGVRKGMAEAYMSVKFPIERSQKVAKEWRAKHGI